MKVLYIWDGDYPWDIRVEKVCNSLLSQNHEVHLVCRNLKRQRRYELYKGVHIHRLSYLPKWAGKLNDGFTFPAFFSPVWLWEIFKHVRKKQCDIILIRDLPMALAGILAGRVARIPTILDMAECYPEQLRLIWRFEKFKLRNIALRNPYLAEIVEYLSVRLVDYILVMIDESKDRLVMRGVNKDKVSIVSNTPNLERFLGQPRSADDSSGNATKKLRLMYVGLLNPDRGLDTVISAAREYSKLNKDFEFIIVGTGKAEPQLRKMVQAWRLEEVITFRGWIDNSEIPVLVRTSDICIVPHHRCGHWETTIPNKLFDYMAAGKPVLVSNVKPMDRIVTRAECGLVYEDFNVADLVASLQKLESSPLRTRLGQKGQMAVEQTYNWKREEKALFDVLARLTSSKNMSRVHSA